jgi:acetate---CoA ligase (ADP-forming)
MTTADADGRQALFNPRSIAIVGASSSPDKIGGLPVAYLKASGFAGPIWPVHPSAAEIQGLPAFRSVGDLPEAPDLAICAVPGAAAEATVQACAAKGVRALIMFTAGFAEVSAEGAATQARMAATARAAGMRLAGPNCMGMANLTTGALCSFHPAFAQPMARDGCIGLVSQSGAFGGLSTLMAHLRGMALSHVITTGNEADVDVADGLLYLTGQTQVKVILLYIEGVRDGARFLEGLRRAHAAGQAVVAIKLGRTAVGSAAAASHTAALAGSDAVADAVLRQFGAYRAQSIEEFFDIACAAAVAGLPRSGRTGIVTVSGGVGVLMADDAGARGLELPALSDATQARVRALVPFAGTRNPLDITGQVMNDKTLLRQAFDLLAADAADLSSILTFQGASLLNEANLPDTLPPWLAVRQQHPERWLGLCGFMAPQARVALQRAGVATFIEPTHGTRAVGALHQIRTALARPLVQPPLPAAAPIAPGAANEDASLAALRAAGITTVDARVARSADEAVQAAAALGYPVVVKLLSADVLHKSDIGGVQLNLPDAAAVRAAFAAVLAAAASHAPQARVDGVLVAPMLRGGIECILGVSRDPVFGPVVMFGLGGLFVEAMGDVAFRVAPFDTDEALRMVAETRASKVLAGLRGAPPSDIQALAQALSDLSCYAAAHAPWLESLEANPVLVRPAGQGLVALDAVLIGRQPG